MAEELKWKGNTGGGTFGQKAMIILLKMFGIKVLYAVMATVVPFYMLFSHKGYLAIYHYFRKQWGFSVWKSFCKTYKNHFLFGQVILDRFAVFSEKKDLFEVEIVGNEKFTQLTESEKGFVIVGSHVGNFEIAGYLLKSYKKRFNALVFAGETQTVKQNRTKILNSNNINLVPVSADMSHLFIATTALANGEIVSMPADRVFGSSKSIECNFMKGKADFPVGAFALATSAEVEVVSVFCIKISAKKYKIFVKPISNDFAEDSTLSRNDKKLKIENSVKNYVTELENIVKQYPEQWFNYYKFWK